MTTPSAGEVDEFSQLLRELDALTEDDFHLISQRWRLMAVAVSTGPPDINYNVAEAIAAASDIISIRRALEQLSPGLDSTALLPPERAIGNAMARANEARMRTAEKTADEDAIAAIAGFAMVVCLHPWVPEAFFDNAAAAFRAARPGFLEDTRVQNPEWPIRYE